MPDAGRIVAGTARGCRLVGPRDGTRPLADRVKQALFAMLESELGDAWPSDVLDLFAGSGSAGIEALSRGADRAVFVERNPDSLRAIRANLSNSRLNGGIVVRSDVGRFLRNPHEASAAARGPFGAVVADPPYADPAALEQALLLIGDPALRWLRDDAIVVSKHFWRTPPPASAGSLSLVRNRRFGETALSFHRRRPTDAGEVVA
jgi:16S rRNA (guanine966-N2)-methyltransferase